MSGNSKINQIESMAADIGFTRAKIIPPDTIRYEPPLRKLCENNACRCYGANYMCPPHIGDVDELIELCKGYADALLVQRVYQLEDSFDIEGMTAAGGDFDDLMRSLRTKIAAEIRPKRQLTLGAGGCKLCHPCNVTTNAPCLRPDDAMSSIEAHGVHVLGTLTQHSIPYNNGEATVSYVGIVFFDA